MKPSYCKHCSFALHLKVTKILLQCVTTEGKFPVKLLKLRLVNGSTISETFRLGNYTTNDAFTVMDVSVCIAFVGQRTTYFSGMLSVKFDLGSTLVHEYIINCSQHSNASKHPENCR